MFKALISIMVLMLPISAICDDGELEDFSGKEFEGKRYGKNGLYLGKTHKGRIFSRTGRYEGKFVQRQRGKTIKVYDRRGRFIGKIKQPSD